jgi:hypothetical protein
MGKESYRDADSHTSTRLNNPTHQRVKEHNRESETLSATIDRALDALEREGDLPDAVAEVLRNDE